MKESRLKMLLGAPVARICHIVGRLSGGPVVLGLSCPAQPRYLGSPPGEHQR
jgi:hypothetical protein